MPLQRVSRVLLAAELAIARQLADCVLDGQVARRRRLRDLDAATGASGHLITQPGIGQHVRETAGTHQVAVRTLEGRARKRKH